MKLVVFKDKWGLPRRWTFWRAWLFWFFLVLDLSKRPEWMAEIIDRQDKLFWTGGPARPSSLLVKC